MTLIAGNESVAARLGPSVGVGVSRSGPTTLASRLRRQCGDPTMVNADRMYKRILVSPFGDRRRLVALTTRSPAAPTRRSARSSTSGGGGSRGRAPTRRPPSRRSPAMWTRSSPPRTARRATRTRRSERRADAAGHLGGLPGRDAGRPLHKFRRPARGRCARLARLVEERIHDTKLPMPQPPNAALSAADLATMDAWLKGGTPKGTGASPRRRRVGLRHRRRATRRSPATATT